MFGEMAAGILLSEGIQSYKIVGSIVIIGGVILVATRKRNSVVSAKDISGCISNSMDTAATTSVSHQQMKYGLVSDGREEFDRMSPAPPDGKRADGVGIQMTIMDADDLQGEDSSGGVSEAG